MTRKVAFASPLIWFANQLTQFALAPTACAWQSRMTLWIVFAVALALEATCGVLAWSSLQTARSSGKPGSPWLDYSGLILSGGFALVIAAQMIPTLILGGCA